MTFVKVCGITSLDDARLAVDFGADALGFVFAESKRHVTIEQVAAITAEISDVMTVGVFRHQAVAEVIAVLQAVRLDAAQIHDDYSASDIAMIKERTGVKVIKAIAFDSPDRLMANTFGADHVLVDAPTPGSGQSFDWSLLKTVNFPFILAGGLSPDNVGAAVAAIHPWGVDAVSGLEASPGVKDPAKVRAFIAAAKAS